MQYEWVAIATQTADGRFVEERLRDVLFGLVLTAAEAELWEPRADWPSDTMEAVVADVAQ